MDRVDLKRERPPGPPWTGFLVIGVMSLWLRKYKGVLFEEDQ